MMDNSHKPAILKLDELDVMLASELELDARQSIRILSRKLGVSEITARKRMLQLLDNKVITIRAFTHPYTLGLQTPVTLCINIVHGKTSEVVEYLQRIKGIQSIILTTGRYDIVAFAVLRNLRDLSSLLYEDLGRIPYLVSTEKILNIGAIKQSWKYLNADTERYREPTTYNLDELDLKLIKELELCPRESIGNLAKKLAVNRNLVSKRLRCLLANGSIRIVSVIEPSFFGFNLDVSILVQVELGKVMSVANSIAAERCVRHIITTTGQFELYLRAAFRDVTEMSDFLRNRLGNYEGIISHETLIHISTLRKSYSFLTNGVSPLLCNPDPGPSQM